MAIVPSEGIVSTLLSGNNNFVSTLDHLPCDVTRSLWFIQMMNLRNTRIELRLHEEYMKPNDVRDNAMIVRMRRLILRNSEELVEESKYLIAFLDNHVDLLHDDVNIINELKVKLPGWTSDAVEMRWKEWGGFKLRYLEKTKGKELNCFEKYLIEHNDEKIVKVQKQARSTHSELKIKINLKNISLKTVTSTLKKSSSRPKDVKRVEKPDVVKVEPVIEPIEEPVVEKVVEETYCFCNGPSSGRMVACEYEKCPHEWFHFKCVNLSKEPDGVWYCSDTCRDKHNDSIQRKKQRKKRRW